MKSSRSNVEFSDNNSEEERQDGSRSQSPWSALRDGSRKSAFLPYKPSVTVLTNLQRGNTKAQTPVLEANEVSFHLKAAQGDLTIKDIEKAEDVNQRDDNGLTPLMWASSYGQFAIVAGLLEASCRVDSENSEGQTALLFAATGGYHEIVRILLISGANVNHQDEAGNTALMYAAHGNHPHTTNELLLRNASLGIVNLQGDTAYSIAVKKESYLVQQVIENHLVSLLTNTT